MTLVSVLIFILIVVGFWKIFEKAGEPGWAAIIPIYNLFILFKIAGKPLWMVLLLLIPAVNIVVMILALIGISKNFGKGIVYAIGLFFLPIIFFPLLGFSDSQYVKVTD